MESEQASYLNEDHHSCQSVRNLGPGMLTIDSDANFCKVTGLNSTTGCCNPEIIEVRDYHANCNENTKCCGSVPDCMAHCLNSGDNENTTFDRCSQTCRTSSKSVNHNRYYNDPQHKYCYGDADASIIKVVKGKENESCTEACHRFNHEYECSPSSLPELNTCPALQTKFRCSQCRTDFESFAPAHYASNKRR